MTYLSRLLGSHELLANLVLREVRGKYRRTFFGQLWSLLNPLAAMLVYTIVFAVIIRAHPPAGDPSGLDLYPLWLLAGLLPWQFFSHSVTGGISSIISNGSLIKKVYFPRVLLPLANAGSNAFTFLIELTVLSIAISLFGGFVLPWVPLLLLTVVALAAFSAGLGMLLAILNVYFRDVQHFTTIVLQLWLYLSPVIYPIQLVEAAAQRHGEWLLILYRLNPMERFISVFRDLLYDNRLPAGDDVLWCLGWAIVVFGAGFLVFARHEKKLAELL